jgi:DNA repair protein RadA/Sms
MKSKISFSCSSCTYKTVKWLGCCPECKEWDSFVEIQQTVKPAHVHVQSTATIMQELSAIPTTQGARLTSGIEEWDRVMGGGIMPDSLIVLTGDPGIGKSTLLLQIAHHLATQYRAYYFSTEESLTQVRQRAERLQYNNSSLLFSDTADLEIIIATARSQKPDIIIIDSIQNCFITDAQSIPGSIGQLREATFKLMRLSKEDHITIIITGHITKEGIIAGPKTLEHMVDAVFYLQGDDRFETRILRSVKNRFGTINELGFFEMTAQGLAEVSNINELLVGQASHTPGSALVSIIEGSRPFIIEVQALTIFSKLTMPQRVISGLDHKQVVLIAAILEKYVRIKLSIHDIFAKVSGGFKLASCATDLGIALALLSSYFQQPLPAHALAFGEINLTGQIRPISTITPLIKEGEKFGITTFFMAKDQKIEPTSAQCIKFQHVYELLSLFSEEKS